MLNLLIQYKFVCMKKLYFKMHSETTLLCCVQPGFLNLRVKLLLLLMLFLGKFSDNKKFLIGQNLLGALFCSPCHNATGAAIAVFVNVIPVFGWHLS